MKIGLVGYQGSGKTTLFEWLTGQQADAALAHTGQSAMAFVPDERIQALEAKLSDALNTIVVVGDELRQLKGAELKEEEDNDEESTISLGIASFGY